jgi:hypothetical protein
MALVQTKWVLSVTLIDVGRKQTKKEYDLVATTDAEAAAAAAAILSDLTGATDLAVSGYSINNVYTEDDLTIPVVLTAKRTNILSLNVQLASSPLKKAVITIPGPKDSLFVGVPGTTAYNDVKLDAALLLAYTDNFRDGATPNASISDGEFMAQTDGHISGVRISRSTTKKNPG